MTGKKTTKRDVKPDKSAGRRPSKPRTAPSKKSKASAKRQPPPKPQKAEQNRNRVPKRPARAPASRAREAARADPIAGTVDELEAGDAADAEKVGPAALTHKRDRVFYIAEEMAYDRWKPEHAADLGKLWGLAVITVQDMACEASRFLEFATSKLQRLETIVKARLYEIQRENGDDRVQALKVLAEVSGLMRQRVKLEHTGPDGQPLQVGASVIILPAKEIPPREEPPQIDVPAELAPAPPEEPPAEGA